MSDSVDYLQELRNTDPSPNLFTAQSHREAQFYSAETPDKYP